MALLKDELANFQARLGVFRLGTTRLGVVVESTRLKAGSGQILWDREIDNRHVLTPYNQGQPPNAADQSIYTTYRS